MKNSISVLNCKLDVCLVNKKGDSVTENQINLYYFCDQSKQDFVVLLLVIFLCILYFIYYRRNLIKLNLEVQKVYDFVVKIDSKWNGIQEFIKAIQFLFRHAVRLSIQFDVKHRRQERTLIGVQVPLYTLTSVIRPDDNFLNKFYTRPR